MSGYDGGQGGPPGYNTGGRYGPGYGTGTSQYSTGPYGSGGGPYGRQGSQDPYGTGNGPYGRQGSQDPDAYGPGSGRYTPGTPGTPVSPGMPGYDDGTGRGGPKQTTVNITVLANQPPGQGGYPGDGQPGYNPSQEDQMALAQRGMGPGGQGDWGPEGYSTSSTTTTRTVVQHTTQQQKTIQTEYKTEKDGVIETRIERKMMITSDNGDDIDHDAALAEAIRTVTEMNPDLSVEKIEIKTESETHDS